MVHTVYNFIGTFANTFIIFSVSDDWLVAINLSKVISIPVFSLTCVACVLSYILMKDIAVIKDFMGGRAEIKTNSILVLFS